MAAGRFQHHVHGAAGTVVGVGKHHRPALSGTHRARTGGDSGWLGTARIAIEVRRWGEYALVIIDEHPLRGPAGMLHNTAVDALVQLRHRSTLARLADAVEKTSKHAHESV